MVVGGKRFVEGEPGSFSLKITGLIGEIAKSDNRENRMPVIVKDVGKISPTKKTRRR